MENTYSKKVHGTAKALPGFASSGPAPVKTSITNVSVPSSYSSPPPPPPPSYAQQNPSSMGGPPPAPRRALPTSLQSAIINTGGNTLLFKSIFILDRKPQSEIKS